MKTLIVLCVACGMVLAAGASSAPPLPEFDEPDEARWLNSPPLEVSGLAGRVVLLEVWTFGCANCTRSLPWLLEIEQRYAKQGLVVVGVHSPEFDYEKDAGRLRSFLDERGISFPNLVDNDSRYWTKLGNRYWPAFYLVDRLGRIRHVFIGETHSGTPRAKEIERSIELLLARRDGTEEP